MEIKGKIKQIEDTIRVSENFSRRDFVITTDEKYPQHLAIQAVNKTCEVLNNFNIGDEVNVSINLRGREYNKKYYNTIVAWKIQKLSESTEVKSNDMPF